MNKLTRLAPRSSRADVDVKKVVKVPQYVTRYVNREVPYRVERVVERVVEVQEPDIVERVEVPVWNGTVANLVSKVLGRVRLKLE